VSRVAGRTGIVAEAVLVPDLAIATVDHELRALHLGRFATGVNRFMLCLMDGRGSLIAFLRVR
jgi:hypothetical protein